MSNNMRNTQKFDKDLGNIEDFVTFLKALEENNGLKSLSDFTGTSTGKRYSMVKKGNAPIIDFRHFFAAASQRLFGSKINKRIFQEEGAVLILGLGNKIAQCVGEAVKIKYNSCFSSEDMGSNRLGVEFAEFVNVRRAGNSKAPLSEMLQKFLYALEPLPSNSVTNLVTASYFNTFREIVGIIFTRTARFIIPKAY